MFRPQDLAALALALVLGQGSSACSKREEPAADDTRPPTSARPATQVGTQGIPLAPPDQLRFVEAPAVGDVAEQVRTELVRTRGEGRQLLVYVGATWCEPCQRFHRAAAHGDLDGAFPKLTLLEYDLDRDGDRLRAAGYRSAYIPLFCAPNPDGKASAKHFAGSVKGEGAVAEITPKLRALLP